MFKTKKFPRGVFTTSHLGWALDRAMCVQTDSAGAETGVSIFPTASLYNNSITGESLAILAILALSTASMPWIPGYILGGSDGAITGTVAPLTSGAPIGAGVGYTNSRFSLPSNANLFSFWADGKTWLQRDGAPLAVLRPAYRLEFFSGLSLGQVQTNGSSLSVSWLWVPI